MMTDEEFEGTTYISHDDPATTHAEPDTSGQQIFSDEAEVPVSPLEARIAKLEQAFEDYKNENEKKLHALEKLAQKQPLTPAERILLIQEDT